MDLLKFKALKIKLGQEGSLSLRVASDSMEPVLKTGQIIQVKKIQSHELKKFDTIVFFQSEKVMCHFLWAIQTDAEGKRLLITKSIKNPQDIDLPLEEEFLLGKVDVKIPFLLKLKIWFKN